MMVGLCVGGAIVAVLMGRPGAALLLIGLAAVDSLITMGDS